MVSANGIINPSYIITQVCRGLGIWAVEVEVGELGRRFTAKDAKATKEDKSRPRPV